MKHTWDYELIDLLKNAKDGSTKELKLFLEKYSPLSVVNEDYSVLLLFRYFQANYTQNEISVLNCHPKDKDFQCGITIVTFSKDGGSQSNIYLPNNFNYIALKIKDKEIEIITSDNKSYKTNVTELFRKLDFWGNFTKLEVENGFKNLCNEQYKKPKKIKVKSKIIKIPALGEFIYNEDFEWYETKFTANNFSFDIILHHTKQKKLVKLIAFVNNQIQNEFYVKMLLAIESEMIKLKNDVWLRKNEETAEEEPSITVDNFRKQISISSIIFYDDCSCSIYCNDNNIFWGHSIEINIDKNGNYKDVNLVG